MNCFTLVEKAEQYSVKYVAIKSFKSKKVICSGDNPAQVVRNARKKGAKDPVVFFVPEKDVVYIY
jgi:2-keto-4-pentenoate hydratase/2-oxohepta-3-ene-1,7-dioic acid hydratase in catechol pathway